jgi:soluble lytic murein transglycosylase
VSVARRRRRRRFLLVLVPLLVVVAVAAVVVALLTGRVIVPAVSGKVYPLHYEKEIAAVAKTYNVDPYLLAAIARTESGFNPDAQSHAGAVGLMQLLPSTAQWVTGLSNWKGPKKPVLTNPQDSLQLGACYLSYLQRTFDNPTAALAAYNAGQNAVRGWVQKAGGSTSFGLKDIPYPETQQYVQRVQRFQALYEKAHPKAFRASQ